MNSLTDLRLLFFFNKSYSLMYNAKMIIWSSKFDVHIKKHILHMLNIHLDLKISNQT